ncbi:hypothetical protein BKA61DRAFT_738735 [Leptodontidium sp. MPI-SDFR-AT-0119]|nr:hypothetical protein BKA61DRAFT_738735 [Leptodontidium sp. MPI-SDFR-AT-0119]
MSQQQETGTPEEQAATPLTFPRDGIPFPIAPQTKATVLITVILLEILSIVLVAVSLPIYARHAGYGRQGAWSRPWNDGGAQASALIWSVISIVTFGCHSLSELHPRHLFYTRIGLFLGAFAVLFWKMNSLLEIIKYAWHFLSFGKKGDLDAYWVGVWTICTLCVTVVSLVPITTYLILCRFEMTREENEATVVDEMSETDPLLGGVVVTALDVAERSVPNSG